MGFSAFSVQFMSNSVYVFGQANDFHMNLCVNVIMRFYTMFSLRFTERWSDLYGRIENYNGEEVTKKNITLQPTNKQTAE